MKNSQKLLDGRLTPSEFLDKIVYRQTEDDFGLLEFNNLNPLIDDEVEEEDNRGSHNEIDEPMSEKSKGHCLLCNEADPQMCVMPCFDFCMCEACFIILKENYDEILCPKCNNIATDVKKMNFI